MTDLQARIDSVMELDKNMQSLQKKIQHLMTLDRIPARDEKDAIDARYLCQGALIRAIPEMVSIIKELQAQLSAKDAIIHEQENIISDNSAALALANAKIKSQDALIAELQKENEWQDIESGCKVNKME